LIISGNNIIPLEITILLKGFYSKVKVEEKNFDLHKKGLSFFLIDEDQFPTNISLMSMNLLLEFLIVDSNEGVDEKSGI
jgi:hypothetical protein